MRFTDLPEELIREIYLFVRCPERPKVHLAMCHCDALTTSCWRIREICLPILLRRCRYTICGENSPGFLSQGVLQHVQYLYLLIDSPLQDEDENVGIDLQTAITSLPLMNRLSEIVVDGFHSSSVWPRLSQALLLIPQLKTLSILRCLLACAPCDAPATPPSKITHITLYPGVHFTSSPTSSYLEYCIRGLVDDVIVAQADTVHRFLCLQGSSIQTLETDISIFATGSTCKWSSLRQLHVRSLSQAILGSFAEIMTLDHFPALVVLDIEIIDTLLASYNLLSNKSISKLNYPRLLTFSLTNRHHRDLIFRHLPSRLSALSIISTTSSGLMRGGTVGFDEASMSNLTAKSALRHIIRQNNLNDLSYLRLGLSTEPGVDFFRTVAAACPRLERLDLHVVEHCEAFISPDLLIPIFLRLQRLRVLCFDAAWKHNLINRFDPPPLEWHRFLWSCAQRLRDSLPSLKIAAYSNYDIHRVFRGWLLFRVDRESFPISSLADMNYDCHPIYTQEVLFDPDSDCIPSFQSEHSPWFRRWEPLKWEITEESYQ